MPGQAPRNHEIKHTLQQAINWVQSYYMRFPDIPLTGLSGKAEELLHFLAARGNQGLQNRVGPSVDIQVILNELGLDERNLKSLYLQVSHNFEKNSQHLNPPFKDHLEEADDRVLLKNFVAQGLVPTQMFIDSLPPYLVKDLAARIELFQEKASKRRGR